MFATGSHDGAVRIWTKPEQPEDSIFNFDIGQDILQNSPGEFKPRDLTESPNAPWSLELGYFHECAPEESKLLRRVQCCASNPQLRGAVDMRESSRTFIPGPSLPERILASAAAQRTAEAS